MGVYGAARRRRRFGGVAGGVDREVAQVLVFLVVEVERPGEGVEDGGAGAGLLAALQADVVLDADPGQGGELLAAQSGGAAQAGADGEADLLGPRLRTAGSQEAAQLHASAVTGGALLVSHGPSVTPL